MLAAPVTSSVASFAGPLGPDELAAVVKLVDGVLVIVAFIVLSVAPVFELQHLRIKVHDFPYHCSVSLVSNGRGAAFHRFDKIQTDQSVTDNRRAHWL